MTPWQLSAAEMAEAARRGAVTARDLVAASLDRIGQIGSLNAFTVIRADQALAEAAALDAMPAGLRGLLHGVPVAIKDFTPTAGDLTTRGSRAFADRVTTKDSEVVARLRRAGAVVVAKTTTPEFAHSGFTRSPLWGETYNPWDQTQTTGGSSGGAGAAVSAGAVPLAEGTDMGGSVRIPAALCGVVGLKPSLGRIPMDILSGCFDTLSHFGPLSRTVADAALFLSATEGPLATDILSQTAPQPVKIGSVDLRGVRIALSVDLGAYEVDPEVEANLRETVQALRSCGAEVKEVGLGWRGADVDLWLRMWAVFQAAETAEIWDDWRDRMDPELVALIEMGRGMSAMDYKRLEVRRSEMWGGLAGVLSSHDALLCPTMCIVAPPVSLRDADFAAVAPDGRLLGMDMTALFNLFGQCPVLSVPSGLTRAGLPTAVQIVGRRFDDAMTLRIGAAIEAARPWAHLWPQV
jgi:Asp-tRNA(Asn)/Glu-tRNA(Gln) amidotransferase A subunit family amidase